VQTLKAYSAVELYQHLLLILALDGYESSALCPGYFTVGERVPGAGGLVIANLKKKFCVHFSIPVYVLYALPISSTVKQVVSHARLTDTNHLK